MRPYVVKHLTGSRGLVVDYVLIDGEVMAIVLWDDRTISEVPLSTLTVDSLSGDIPDIFDWSDER